MSQADRLDRDLTAWFVESAAPSVPAWTDDLLRATAGSRQRPRWSFVTRWLPMAGTTARPRAFARVPWRVVVLVALLLALVGGALLVVGSRPRVPPPFGRAANGLVAYASVGDIHVVDPATGVRGVLVPGLETDSDPRWSRDGTRLAFMRGDGIMARPAFVNADGSGLVEAQMEPMTGIDSDSITWSPDSSAIAFTAGLVVHVVEATDGRVTRLDEPLSDGELYWRPPGGRQLLYLADAPAGQYPLLVDVASGRGHALPVPRDIEDLGRASGWTADGGSYLVLVALGAGRMGTLVVDAATGTSRVLPVAYGQVSNDGTRVVGLNADTRRGNTWLCVVPIAGGDCTRISDVYHGQWDTYYRWSPDDRWVFTRRDDGRPMAFGSDGTVVPQPAWVAEGAESWQPVAF